MRKEFVWILLVIGGFSGSLLAQEEQTGYELGVYAAQQNWQSRTFQIGPPRNVLPVDFRLRYKDEIAYGVRGNFLSKGHWGGELSWSYQKNSATITSQSRPTITLDGAVQHAFYNQIFYLVRYGGVFTPFITGGIGAAIYQVDEASRARAVSLGRLKSFDSRVALNYGAGVKVNVTSHFGFRADFRHIFSDVPSYGLPKESPNTAQFILPVQGKLQTAEGSVGIYVRGLDSFH
jgi:opacity protein-like surface antigen